jgi:hypothetical protein
MDVPRLIERQTSAYMMNTLQQCHEKRVQLYSFLFNVTIVVVFLVVVAVILYSLFRQKRTPDEEKDKILHDQKFILEKIKALKEQKQYYLENESITKMPMPELDTNTHAHLFY